MHPRNKLRLLAGLTIDHSLEITEAREVPNRRDVEPANERTLAKKEKDLNKAAMHLENAVKALEAAPATDTNAEIPQIIKDIEELIKDVNAVADKTAKTKPIKEMDISFDTSSQPSLPSPEEATPSSTSDYDEGDVVLFDNGIWVVYKFDKEANKVGIIPPDLHGKEPEECAKAMQMVDPGKVRKPNNAESSILVSGADNKLGTADDVRTEGMDSEECEMTESAAHKCPECGCDPENPDPKCDCTYNTFDDDDKQVKESTMNFTPANAASWKEYTDGNPVNSVPQGEGNWKTEPRKETPSQAAQIKDMNNEQVRTIKVPAKIKSALNAAISEFEAEAKKQGTGATAEENKQFYTDAANAFKKLVDYLDGSVEGMKQAQIFASSLMGPMVHKIPSEVWKFITNGGQQRGLRDYMHKG